MKQSFSLKYLSAFLGAQLIGDQNIEISGVEVLEHATNTDASFLANHRYIDALKKSKAGVICVSENITIDSQKNYLVSKDPSLTFQKIVELFIPKKNSSYSQIHPSAVIHPSVIIGENVTIGPFVAIDQNCTIGSNTVIYPNTTIGFDVNIGTDCIIHSNVSIREGTKLGNRVIIQPGAVLGSCGFGYLLNEFGKYIKLEQLGIVVIEDDVEIGANTTIDRARFKETIIRSGSKIDNLVQIGHNVEIGAHNVIAAQTGIAGSAKTGKYVMMGGQCGVVGHIKIDDKVMLATRSGVSKSLKEGTYRGAPAIPIQEYNNQEVYIRKLERLFEKVKNLEDKYQDKVPH